MRRGKPIFVTSVKQIAVDGDDLICCYLKGQFHVFSHA